MATEITGSRASAVLISEVAPQGAPDERVVPGHDKTTQCPVTAKE
jgi:hypothetical protein